VGGKAGRQAGGLAVRQPEGGGGGQAGRQNSRNLQLSTDSPEFVTFAVVRLEVVPLLRLEAIENV